MRLFVAVWPVEPATSALSEVSLSSATADLRWVPSSMRHVTLAFLGSVPDEEHEELVEALRSVGTGLAPSTAVLGPTTSVLGTRVLCVPVSGLDELASAVRMSTARFNRSPDRDEPFVGHLTLARARRGRPIPSARIGVPVSSAWPVSEIRLMSSETGRKGTEYTPTALVPLEG